MKVKVIRQFRDKYTNQLYQKGRIIETTKERYEEMNSTAHGILVQAVEEIKADDVKKDEDVNFDEMTKKEIVEYAKNKGIELNMRMTKDEMIKELM